MARLSKKDVEAMAKKKVGCIKSGLEPDEESKQNYLAVSMTTTPADEDSEYLGYISISKKSTIYKAIYSAVIEKYPTELWEGKKLKIAQSFQNYLCKKGFEVALFNDEDPEKVEIVKNEISDIIA